MSLSDFSSAVKSKGLRDWFNRLSTDNILKLAAKDIRKQESGSEYNSFYITVDNIKSVLEKLTNRDISDSEVDNVFNKLKTLTYGRTRKALSIQEPYIKGTGLYFPKISFSSISTVLDKAFSDYTVDNTRISQYFQLGHVFGIFPKKLNQTIKSLEASTADISKDQKQLLLNVLKDLSSELTRQDLATSNLKTNAFSLYAKYSKTSSRYLVELQLKEDNEAAGREQSEISKAVRKYFNPAQIVVEKNGNVKFTQGAGASLIKELVEKNINNIYGSKGSPRHIEMLADDILSILSGKTKKLKTLYSIHNTKIISSKPAKIDVTQAKKQIKSSINDVNNLIAKVNGISVTTTKYNTANIANLQVLLQERLSEQVRKNMGTGNDKKILNYRSGRLANSASIERISESRAGMVSIFYNYMRNPYATFSEGGRQQYPRSRDPKLLISKSIRELAMPIVGSRMRAVLV